MESNDSPEIPDRGETSDIPGLPSRGEGGRRYKTPPPSTSLRVVGKIAGVNTTSLGGYLHSTKTRARWAEEFHDELNGHVFDLETDGLR